MFGGLIEKGFLDAMSPDITARITHNRTQYEPARQKVFAYCADKSLIVSDIRTLLSDSDPLDAQIHVYCDAPVQHARAITDALYTMSRWVKMGTTTTGEEMVIYFDTIPLVYVTAIKKHRSISLQDLIAPVDIDGVSYMSPEIELIDLYRILYTPNMECEWEKSVLQEKKLMTMVHDRVDNKILGGKKKKCNDCSQNRSAGIDQMRIAVLEGPCQSEQYVVVGHWAVALAKGDTPPQDKLQIICGDVELAIKCIMDTLQQHTRFAVTFTQQNLHIPKDFRTRRYTLYIQYPSLTGGTPMKKPFMDVFNSAEFELIPYAKVGKYMLGSPYVLLRFFMIDLWIVRLVYKLNLIDQGVLRKKIRILMEIIDSVDRHLPDGPFFGVVSDPVVSKKIASLTGKRHFPYYPAK
jgi:hypothetical protein